MILKMSHLEEIKFNIKYQRTAAWPLSPDSCTSYSSSICDDSSPGKIHNHVLTIEEALVVTETKGNLLFRIYRLEEHVHKLEEDMKAMKNEHEQISRGRSSKKFYELRSKSHQHLGLEQLKRQIRRRSKRPVEPPTGFAREDGRSLLSKILQAPKGFGFLLGPRKVSPVSASIIEENCEKKQVEGKREGKFHQKNVVNSNNNEDEAAKKKTGNNVSSKLRSLGEEEFARIFSLQGIQTYSSWRTRHER